MLSSSAESLIQQVEAWISQDPDPECRTELETLLVEHYSGLDSATRRLKTLFDGRLTFGTAGIRGSLRPGPAGMNQVVVSQTTAGLAQFLLIHRKPNNKSFFRVVVGCDGRRKSDLFAEETLAVLSGHGIEAIPIPQRLPTPVLAFAVRNLSADAGVMITASHNPPGDNGYKVYLGGSDEGSQIIPPVDHEIESLILATALDQTIEEIPRNANLITLEQADICSAYVREVVTATDTNNHRSELRVTYSAMHGVGGQTFLMTMREAGFSPPHLVEEQFDPNPDFPTVSSPNPEEHGALDLCFEKARSVGADIIIAHDPDADRLAVALPDSNDPNGYRALTGNQVGAIFGWHIAHKARSSEATGTLANSLVSSPVLGKIARHCGLDHQETLTGFKYVSRVKNLIFGFEEALGYLVTPDVVRDKDGISAGLLMVSIAHTLASDGRTLWDYLDEIEATVGAFASGQITIRLAPGTTGSTVTTALRERELSAIGSRTVTRHDDFLNGMGDFPQEDILRYYLEDATRVIARPSGTEPKVKVYIDTEGATSSEAQNRLTEVESDINALISSL